MFLWKDNGINYRIEYVYDKGDMLLISGWAICNHPIEIKIYNHNNKLINSKIHRLHRYEMNKFFPDVERENESGFEIRINKEDIADLKSFIVEFSSENDKVKAKLSTRDNEVKQIFRKTITLTQKAYFVYKFKGIKEVFLRIKNKLTPIQKNSYKNWYQKHEPSKRDLELQKENQKIFAKKPLISVVVPAYKTPKKYLDELIYSLQNQTYENWELCIADASKDEEGVSILEPLLEEWHKKDSRVRYSVIAENKSIADNTNEAIKMALGEYIAFSDHDDTLSPNAFYEIVNALQTEPEIDVFYSDQDNVDSTGKLRFDPLWKPDFNIDFLRTCNYITHLFVVKKALADKIGYLDSAYDGSQDYEFIFRCCENAVKIKHIPKILYHWRASETSTAGDWARKMYAFEAGARAINDHYKRCGIPATVEHTEYIGKYHVTYHWEGTPLISIIIPNKDHIKDLDTCISSIINKSSYKNFEIIIVENNSENESTFEYYKDIQAKYDFIKVVYYSGGFNFSKIINYGVEHANGEYLLLLNNDIECINGELLKEMLGFCRREDVGVVGARLLYENETIQHAGVIIGYGRVAGHAFLEVENMNPGNLGRIVSSMDYSAVTGACLMTKKTLFDDVNGFNEDLAVAFNDIDYCLKIREKGYLVVYNPHALAFHYESRSRGYETTPEKKERYEREADIFRKNWQKILDEGDPYYNPNLTLEKADFSEKRDWEYE